MDALEFVLGMPDTYSWQEVCTVGYHLARLFFKEPLSDWELGKECYPERILECLAQTSARKRYIRPDYSAHWDSFGKEITAQELIECGEGSALQSDEDIWGNLAHTPGCVRGLTKVYDVYGAGALYYFARHRVHVWAMVLDTDGYEPRKIYGVLTEYLSPLEKSVVWMRTNGKCSLYKINGKEAWCFSCIDYTSGIRYGDLRDALDSIISGVFLDAEYQKLLRQVRNTNGTVIADAF